jgi:hypothetical protein
MKKTSKVVSIAKTIAARMLRPMSTLLLVMLGGVVVSVFLFSAFLFRESLEDADFALKVFSGVLAVLVVGVGLAALITGELVNERLKMRVAELGKEAAELNKEVAEARTKQAEAELRVEEVRKAQLPRALSFDFEKFAEALKGKPTGTAILLYKEDDSEALVFASHLARALESVGWNTNRMPTPISSVRDVVKGHSLTNARSSGVSILAKTLSAPGDATTTHGALVHAFLAEGSGVNSLSDETLPDNVFRIVVGPKP